MLKVLIYALPFLLALYAVIDCIQTDENEIRGLPRIGWIALIVLIAVVGPIAWLIAGRPRSGRSLLAGLPGLSDKGGARPRPGERPRSLAPDDDPEFLGQLGSHNSYDRQLEEWEEDLRRRTDGGPHGAGQDGDDPADDGPDGDVPAR